MSNNSAKQRITQLMEWMKTMNIQRKKPVKSKNSKPNYIKQVMIVIEIICKVLAVVFLTLLSVGIWNRLFGNSDLFD